MTNHPGTLCFSGTVYSRVFAFSFQQFVLFFETGSYAIARMALTSEILLLQPFKFKSV